MSEIQKNIGSSIPILTPEILERSRQLDLQEDDDLAIVIAKFKSPLTSWPYFYMLAYDFDMNELRGFILDDEKPFYTWVAYSEKDLKDLKVQRDLNFTEKNIPQCAKENDIQYPFFIEWAECG